MRISKEQLRQIIKEELGAVSNAPRTADRFLEMIRHQFRRAKNRATVENMARYYDKMIVMASDSAPFDTFGPLDIADALGLDRENPYWSWVRHHLQHLIGVPPEAIDALPPSAEFTPAAMAKVDAAEERRATNLKKLAAIDPKDLPDGAAAYYKKYGTRGEF
jgi:hypothetical protein